MNSRLQSPKKLAPDPDTNMTMEYPDVSEALSFSSSLFHTIVQHEINKPINQPNVLVLDTSIVNEAKQVINEMKDYPRQLSRCLAERATKLIRLINGTGVSDTTMLWLVNQKKYKSISPYREFQLVNSSSVNEMTQQTDERNKSPISYSRKTEAVQCTPIRRAKVTQNAKQTLVNVKVQTEPNISLTKINNYQNQLEDEPRPEPLHPACHKQNCSLAMNQSVVQNRRKPTLAFSPTGFINIHEVLRTRRDSRSHDSDNMLKMEQFKNKIEKDIEAINKELDEIKNKKTRILSTEDEQISALQAQIQSLSKPISVRLDISQHVEIQKSNKTPKSKSPIRVTSFTIGGNRFKTRTPTKSLNKSPIKVQQTVKQIQKDRRLLTGRINHWKK